MSGNETRTLEKGDHRRAARAWLRWHPIFLGVCNAYLIEGPAGAVLVDGGLQMTERFLFRYLSVSGVVPSDVKLIVVTHAHFDHVGGLRAIRDLCQCPIAMHPADATLVRRGEMVFPPGINRLGRLVSEAGRLFGGRLVRYPPVEADLLISEETDLAPFGVPGTILPTPGHTDGSLSVLLPNGASFVGDSAANIFPGKRGPILPPFAQDLGRNLDSWAALLDRGSEVICPGHGRPFGADRLRENLVRLKGARAIEA